MLESLLSRKQKGIIQAYPLPTFEERIKSLLGVIVWPHTTILVRCENNLCLVQLDIPNLGQIGFWLEEKTGANSVDSHELYDYLWRRIEREMLVLARWKYLQAYKKR